MRRLMLLLAAGTAHGEPARREAWPRRAALSSSAELPTPGGNLVGRRAQEREDRQPASLASAPATVAIDGLACQQKANVELTLAPASIRGRPHYVSSDGQVHLFWSDAVEEGSWVVDTDTAISNGWVAATESNTFYPPPGTRGWVEDCPAAESQPGDEVGEGRRGRKKAQKGRRRGKHDEL